MSVIFRPAGDVVAVNYGPYFDENRVRQIQRGERYEILCTDGLNYIVEVKFFNPENCHAHLHFCHWKTRFDYKGSIAKIYIVEEGTYSKPSGITALNTYEFEEEIAAKKSQKANVAGRKPPAPTSAYFVNTKYDDDFFSKPRPSWAKKRRSSEDGKNGSGSNTSSDDSDDDSDADDDDTNGGAESSRKRKRKEDDTVTFADVLNAPSMRHVQATQPPDQSPRVQLPAHDLIQRFLQTGEQRKADVSVNPRIETQSSSAADSASTVNSSSKIVKRANPTTIEQATSRAALGKLDPVQLSGGNGANGAKDNNQSVPARRAATCDPLIEQMMSELSAVLQARRAIEATDKCLDVLSQRGASSDRLSVLEKLLLVRKNVDAAIEHVFSGSLGR